MMANLFHIAELENRRTESARAYLEFLRVSSMSAGVYVLPAGGSDPQTPHNEDEMYYVVRGRARIQVGSDSYALEPGSLVFVAAHVAHHFYEISEELTLVVFFAPAQT